MEYGKNKRKIQRKKEAKRAERDRERVSREDAEERTEREQGGNCFIFSLLLFKVVLSMLLFLWNITNNNFYPHCSFPEFIQIILSPE